MDRKISAAAEYRPGIRNGSLMLPVRSHGRYRCEGLSFRFSDAAGFFRFVRSSGDPVELTVFPDTQDDFDIPDSFNSGGEDISRLMKKKRNDELIESRQYFPGDDVRRINWKTFAHSGELFIRQGEEIPFPESRLLLVVDLSGIESSGLNAIMRGRYLDRYASCLAGLINQLAEAGIGLDLLLPPGPAAAAGESFLPGLWWNDAELENGSLSGRKDRSYIVFASAFSERGYSICAAAAAEGKNINVLIPGPGAAQEAAPKGLLHSLLFTGGEKKDPAGSITAVRAAGLAEELRGLKGVDHAYII